MRTVRTVLLAAATIIVATAPPASAQQSYPNRPIQLVVPVPPGGAADFIARTVSAKLADALGQPVVINNQGGAGGTIASRGVAKAEPDGYTLLLNSITTHGIGPHLYATLPYDLVTDFVPVILLAKLPLIMALAIQPVMLLLDEPMAGLGIEESRAMSQLLASIKGQYTILLIEHDMDIVFSLADRISVLVGGRIIASGTADEIRNHPAVRVAYLGEEDNELDADG